MNIQILNDWYEAKQLITSISHHPTIPYQLLEWPNMYWDELSGDKKLVLVSSPEAMLPLQLRKIENYSVLEFIASRCSDYVDMFGNYAHAEVLLKFVHDNIDWDVFRIEDLSETSKLYTTIKKINKVKVSTNINCVKIHNTCHISARMESSIRYYSKKISSIYSSHKFVFGDHNSQLKRYLNLHESRQSRKHGYNLDDRARVFLHRFFKAAGNDCRLLLLGLYIEDNLAAGVISITLGKTIFAMYTGFDQAFASCSPGILLHHYNINKMTEFGFDSYDLTRGDEEYKLKLGGIRHRNLLVEFSRVGHVPNDFDQAYNRRYATIGYGPTEKN